MHLICKDIKSIATGQKTLEGHVTDEWNGYCLAIVVTDVVCTAWRGGFGRECDGVHQRLYVCVRVHVSMCMYLYMGIHVSVCVHVYICMCLYVHGSA